MILTCSKHMTRVHGHWRFDQTNMWYNHDPAFYILYGGRMPLCTHEQHANAKTGWKGRPLAFGWQQKLRAEPSSRKSSPHSALTRLPFYITSQLSSTQHNHILTRQDTRICSRILFNNPTKHAKLYKTRHAWR